MMVLTKATQKAVIDSAPGFAGSGAGDEDEASGAEAEDEDAEEDDEEAESGDEKKKGGKKDKSNLGIDILISTPERLHHLLQENKLSLSSYVPSSLLCLDSSNQPISTPYWITRNSQYGRGRGLG